MMPVAQPDGMNASAEVLRQAIARLNDGEPGEALALLQPLLVDLTPSVEARFALAMTAWKLDRLDWALSILQQCHEDAPDNGSVAETLASLYGQLGNLRESLFTGKLATALGSDAAIASLVPARFPAFEHAFLSIVEHPLLGKARRALADGKIADAVEKSRQHVAIEPDHLEGRRFHAAVLMRTGAPAAAIDALAVTAEQGLNPDLATIYARALAAAGEKEDSRQWYDVALASAPDDAAIAAAPIADAVWLGNDRSHALSLSQDWASRFATGAKAPVRNSASAPKLVIGYLVSAFVDSKDAAAVAAVARAHDRARVTVLGYGIGPYTSEENNALTGAFARWRDIGPLDPATLARTWSGDGVDVLVDASGFSAPKQLQALARCTNAVRVSWFGNPGGIGAPFYDASLGVADYPVLPMAAKTAAPSGDTIAFGADVVLPQLDEETVALWSSILTQVPQAHLLLRANDLAAGANVTRLIRRFGETLAARIDIRQAASSAEFYAAVDIALLPCLGASPRVAADALANGVPVVALKGEGPLKPFGDFVEGHGLGKRFVAADDDHYRNIALSLAASPVARILPAIETGAERLAQAVEELAAAINRQGAAA
jgi:predicted O-linked N-acetylglucosamine transferase (SPINDLY family)